MVQETEGKPIGLSSKAESEMPFVLTSSLIRQKKTFVPAAWFGEHLSPHRANGLSLPLARIRELAMAHVSDNLAAGGA